MKIPVTYIGFCEKMVKELLGSDKYELKTVILQEGRVSENIYHILRENKIKCFTVNSKEEICNLKEWIDTDVCIMYMFGYILPDEVVYSHNIFNIHEGDLRTNRGAHPINWSILNGDQNTRISLHKLGAKIDTGELISELDVKIEDTDDTETLRMRMQEKIDVLLEDMYGYLQGRISSTEVEDGIYRRKIGISDIIIDVEKDNYKQIQRKVNSQRQYNGAILDIGNFRFRVMSVEKKEK